MAKNVNIYSHYVRAHNIKWNRLFCDGWLQFSKKMLKSRISQDYFVNLHR